MQWWTHSELVTQEGSFNISFFYALSYHFHTPKRKNRWNAEINFICDSLKLIHI